MSEEKDAALLAAEASDGYGDHADQGPRGVVPQLEPSPGMPVRQGALRRRERVAAMMHQLPVAAQHAILRSHTATTGGARP